MIPYDLTTEFRNEYRRILIVDRAQYDRVLDFIRDDAMWREQYRKQAKKEEGAACTLRYELEHLQSGGLVDFTLESHTATTDPFGGAKPAPWVRCDGAVNVRGFAKVKYIPEIEEIPHIFLSLLDNDVLLAMQCGRVVLICDDPDAPTLVDVGLCKGKKKEAEC